jgi:hypothetical protein
MLVRFGTKWRGVTEFIAVLANSYLVMEVPLYFVEDVEISHRLVRGKLGHLVLLR